MSSDLDRLTGHDYDGIEEYDNPLPRWWLQILWASVFFSFLYLGYYHSREDRSITAEYDAEMQAWYERQTEELLAMGKIDEAMIATLMKTPSAMNEAAKTFADKCVMCHAADGGGKIGPNLTDSHWLHGNTLMEIYATVRDGVRGKGMKAWSKELRPDLVLKMAAYVGTLRERHVEGGKPPEGKKLAPAALPDLRKAADETGSAAASGVSGEFGAYIRSAGVAISARSGEAPGCLPGRAASRRERPGRAKEIRAELRGHPTR